MMMICNMLNSENKSKACHLEPRVSEIYYEYENQLVQKQCMNNVNWEGQTPSVWSEELLCI